MNLDKELKNLSFRIGSEISNIAKQKTAPIGKYPPGSDRNGGNLKKDIEARNVSSKGVTIGNTLKAPYAKFVHFGTGLYGPKKRRIKPLKAKALKTSHGYFKSTAGMKPNPYLKKALNEYVKSGGLNRAVKSFADEVGKEIVKDIKVSFK